MTRIRLVGTAVAAAGVIGIAAWATGSSGQQSAGRWETPAVAERKAAVQKVPPPAGAADRTPAAEPGPAQKPDQKPDQKKGHRAPAPFVQRFADQRGVKRQGPKKKAPVKVAPTVDGCDRSYGTVAQCIPLVFPGKPADKCAWLREHGYRAVRVAGKDKQKLDPDRNGVACG